MNKLHIVLYQPHVQQKEYIPSLLAKQEDLSLHIVTSFSLVQECLQAYPVYGILYVCDTLSLQEQQDIHELTALTLPYLILTKSILIEISTACKDRIILMPKKPLSSAFIDRLFIMIKMMASGDESSNHKKSEGFLSTNVIGIGASAGGPKALGEILKKLPATICGIIIVQHISEGTEDAFAHYLNDLSALHVRIAIENDVVRNGVVYLAKQKQHLIMKREEDGYHLHYIQDEKVNCVRPSIDVLFTSIAEAAGSLSAGVLLTGMGKDGAMGLKAMKDAGAFTIIQDQASSELYSMPWEAKKLNAQQAELALSDISQCLIQHVTYQRKEGTHDGNKNHDC